MAYSIPKPGAPQGGNLPFLGPYAQNQAAAQLAFQRAQTSLAAQRGALLQQYGYTPNAAGGISVDSNNPYGMYQQMLGANQQESQSLNQSMVNRGFGLGAGFGAQAETAGQKDAGGRSFQLAQALSGALEGQNEAGLSAQDALDQATIANQQGTTDYAIQHGIFTPAAVRLSDQEAQKRVQAMKAAWNAAFKKNGKGTRVNAKGMTFQDRLNAIGSDLLYNPTSTIKVGGRQF